MHSSGCGSIQRSADNARVNNLLPAVLSVMHAQFGWLMKGFLYRVFEVKPNEKAFRSPRLYHQWIESELWWVVCVGYASRNQFDASDGNRRIG